MFFIIPSILSFTTQIFRPNLVKKSWDSVNIVLVLFALVFGFLSRNKNYDEDHHQDHQTVSSNVRNEVQKSDSSTVDRWYEYSDHRTVYDSSGVGGLRRTSRASSSYPDLREASPWDAAADDRWQFADDTQVDAYQHSESDRFRRRRSWKRIEEEEEDEGSDRSKTIHADTLVIRAEEEGSYTQLRTSPPPPPLPVVHRKPKRTYESIAHKEKRKQQVKNESEPTTSAAPPPPPRPLSPPSMSSEKKSSKSDRKRSGGANVTKDFLTSLYHQSKKKKKQRQKSVDNFESLLQSQSLFQSPPLILLPPPSPPPPPPPPPPPASVFQNMFSSKKGKSKKILTIPPPPPPPPPVTTARASKTTIQTAPMKINNFNNVEEKSNSGGESPLTGSELPLIRIPPPPPPPPPPFKMPAWKFVVQGDYVRIGSMNSSRSGSSDVEDGESPRSEVSIESSSATTAVDGGEAVAQPLFCPSPDVNTKADMFIAKFRAGLKLQKINSIKRLGLSNLGPETKSEPGPSQI